MGTGVWPGDMRVEGQATFQRLHPTEGCVEAEHVAAAANIEASKLMRRVSIPYRQSPGTAVVDATELLYTAKKAGQLVRVTVVTTTHPTTTDTVTVDVQKSSAGGAFATVLSAVETLNSATTDRAVNEATIDPAEDDYIADDVFQVVVNATGTSGQGLLVVLEFEENGT